MATGVRARTGDDDVRGSLLGLSARLESEWLGVSQQLQDAPPGSEERRRWAAALDRLTEALSSLEGYAHRVDTTLGRRDWAARRPRLYGVPVQRPRPPRRRG